MDSSKFNEISFIKSSHLRVRYGNRRPPITDDTKMIMEELEKLNAKVTHIHLTLENETNRNIRIIAEGHLDLSRKPDDALKVENEKEMLLIRINYLESEIRKIKQKIIEID